MRNNRSIALGLSKSRLLMQKDAPSPSPPPFNSLFWRLWNSTLPIANKTLGTPFIQSIQNGKLSPDSYGSFYVSDAYYCFNGAQAYLAAESKAEEPILKAFLLAKYNSYQAFNDSTFVKNWHLRDANGIIPSLACKQYADYESLIASHEAPIYTLIMMLPCEYLWAWLGGQLAQKPVPKNLYQPWIDGNNDPSGAYRMGNFLADYQAAHSIDEAKAFKIYQQAMSYEFENFATALKLTLKNGKQNV